MSDRVRRVLAWSGALVLALSLLARDSGNEIPRRMRVLSRSASRELAVRRLAGSGTAFDRSFFVFVESVRRALPAGAAGVALYASSADERELYLASYVLAPVPVLLAPTAPPRGWISAVYGEWKSGEGRLVARVPGGALVADASRPPLATDVGR